MPKVGKKKYPYTKKGKAAAAKDREDVTLKKHLLVLLVLVVPLANRTGNSAAWVLACRLEATKGVLNICGSSLKVGPNLVGVHPGPRKRPRQIKEIRRAGITGGVAKTSYACR